jgi:hypothetical protein
MSVSLICRHCNEEMSADDKEQLVGVVQRHVAGHAAEHGREHSVSREDVLARLDLQERQAPS